MVEITLSKLNKPKVNSNAITEDFDVFSVVCDEYEYCVSYARITDLGEKSDSVYTAMYSDKKLYLLCEKEAFKVTELQNLLQEKDENLARVDKLDKFRLDELSEYILLKLFFNMVSGTRLFKKIGKYNRIFFVPTTRNRKTFALDEVKLNQNFNMWISSTTFTNKKMFTSDKEDQKRIAKKAIYQIDFISNTMKNVLKGNQEDGEQYYNLPRFKGAKPKFPSKFFADKNAKDKLGRIGKNRLNAYLNTKSGKMFYIIDQFNQQFSKYFSNLSFITQDVDRRKLDMTAQAYVKDLKSKLVEFSQKHEIYLIDETEEHVALINYLKDKFKSLKIEVTLADKNELAEGDLAISLIHDQEFYNKNKDKVDPHQEKSLAIIQHITVEDAENSFPDATLYNLINQLIIKYDLNKGKLTIASISEKIRQFKYYAMFDENAYEMKFSDPSHFEINRVTSFDKISILDDPKIELMIEDSRGNYYKIFRLDTVTLPNKVLMDDWKEAADNGELVTARKTANRIKYISGLFDISYWKDSKDFYYIVGGIPDALQQSVARGFHVRKIEKVEKQGTLNNEEIFDLIEMMMVPTIKYANMTVLPFPKKYLTEAFLADRK